MGVKHLPLPAIPSSHDVHPVGHAWQVGPKNPAEQDSHEVPLNPVGHVHVPWAEQTPEPAQGGEQADDCISKRAREFEDPEGSWATSGIESQSTIRFEPELTATQTLLEIERDPAERGVEEFEEGDVGSWENDPWPE